MIRFPIHIITGAILLLCTLPAAAQEYVSDYEIYQSFQDTYGEIEREIETVNRSGEADSLMMSIRQLELEHEKHRVMLDQALYPETFYGRVNHLKQQTITLRDRLLRIERLSAQVEELNLQVASYEQELEQLDHQADSLAEALARAGSRNESLSTMVEEYRHRLQQRDRFILGVVDSMMTIYEKIDMQVARDLNLRERAALGQGSNPLALIEQVAIENGGYLEGINELTPVDYLRMKTVQAEFGRLWNRLGDNLVMIYATGEPERVSSEINRAIGRWNERVTNQMWIALNESIRHHEIPVGEVRSRDELFDELSGYVRESIRRSREGSGQPEEYQRFSTFWNDRFKMEWAEYAARAEVMSHRQMAVIDQDLREWEEATRSGTSLFAYLFGICVVVLLAVTVLLYREKYAAEGDGG